MPLTDSEHTRHVSIGASAILSPVPAVLVSCQGTLPEHARPNLITIAWAGTVCTQPPMVSVSVKPERYSHALLEESGCFCINFVNEALCRAADFCGVRSGRDLDKFEVLGLHPLYFPDFPVPALAESPVALLCRVTEKHPLGSHDQFLARVEDVRVSPALLDEHGALHLERASLVSYAHGQYFGLNPEPLGFFGYSVARQDVLRRRLGKPAGRSSSKQTERKPL